MHTLQFPTPATGQSRTAKAGDPMRYHSFPDLITAYLDEHLQGKASYAKQFTTAKQWILTLTSTPTRQEVLARHRAKGHGNFQKGACQANTELALIRAACRWGLYQERWTGGDPTVGVRKWQTSKRKRVAKVQEIRLLLDHFNSASEERDLRDRALYGLMLFTGCRPGEARAARLDSITAYGTMGCWKKGKTKNGEEYEVPVPSQYLPWLATWQAVRPNERPSPYLFPGKKWEEPISDDWVGNRWHELRLMLRIQGLWTYDLRRSLATHLSNELNYSNAKIDAILGHENTTSLGHYLHVSFDAMTEPIQHYADWLCGLRQESKGGNQESMLVSMPPVVPAAVSPPSPLPVIVPPVVDTSDDMDQPRLSRRERETLVWFAQGQSCKDIAVSLGLSIKTVSTYRMRLMDKLQLTNTMQLIHYALEHKAELLLPVPAPPTPPPVIAPAVVVPMPAPVPISYRSQSVEREEWPG